MIAAIPVPQQYLGVWQRKLLQSSAEVDKSSHVYWLQTPVLHADIRIPADRPAFKDKKSLLDFSLSELQQLAGQKGFAGETSVIGNSTVTRAASIPESARLYSTARPISFCSRVTPGFQPSDSRFRCEQHLSSIYKHLRMN